MNVDPLIVLAFVVVVTGIVFERKHVKRHTAPGQPQNYNQHVRQQQMSAARKKNKGLHL